MEGRALVVQMLIATIEQFFMAYMVVSLTDRRRIRNKYICLLIGTLLMDLAVYNNLAAKWFDTITFSTVTVIVIVFLINKDRLRRKLLIIFYSIATGMAALVIVTLVLYMCNFVGRYYIYAKAEEWSDTILMTHWSEMLIIGLYMLEIVLHKRKALRGVLFPIVILFIIPTVMFVYILPIYSRNLYTSFGYTVFWSIVILGTTLLGIFSVMSFYRRYEKVRLAEKEKAIMDAYIKYDSDYYERIQREIERARFMRHDVVNYIEQIEHHLAQNTDEDKSIASEMIDEILINIK